MLSLELLASKKMSNQFTLDVFEVRATSVHDFTYCRMIVYCFNGKIIQYEELPKKLSTYLHRYRLGAKIESNFEYIGVDYKENGSELTESHFEDLIVIYYYEYENTNLKFKLETNKISWSNFYSQSEYNRAILPFSYRDDFDKIKCKSFGDINQTTSEVVDIYDPYAESPGACQGTIKVLNCK